MKITNIAILAAGLALTTTAASAFTCKNEYRSINGLTIMTSSVCGTAGDFANGTANQASAERLRDVNVRSIRSKFEKTDEQKAEIMAARDARIAQIALNAEYIATRAELESYYKKYDLDTGLIDTEVQAGIDAALAGDLELAYDLSVEFWLEHMVNPEGNVWEYDDYKATEPLTAKLAELQAQGAEY